MVASGYIRVPLLRPMNAITPRARSLTSELAACVWIPLFSLRCEEERHPEFVGKPTALLSLDDSRRLWQVSSPARHAGVKPGMTISQAIGLCGTLTLCEPDPVYYDERFAGVLLRMSRISPVIEPAELGRAFVGVDGLQRLHGPPERQLEVIAGAAKTLSARLGWARAKSPAGVPASRARPGEAVIVPD